MLKNVCKGMVIGIANIIPGVSGGTMMVAMGIYDKLIHCITHLFSELKKNIAFLFPIILGMGIAIIASSLVLESLFAYFPLPTNFLFIGLIFGGLPAVWKNVKGNTIKIGHIISFLVFFVLVAGLAIMGEKEGKAADLTLNAVNIVKLFGVGIVASATMVIPGVSGSMMLLLMGYYNPILSTINSLLKALVAFDISGILTSVGVLLPFGVGIVVGIFGIAKIVEILFEKAPLYVFWAIIGLIVASPIAIIAMNLGAFTTLMPFGIGTVITVLVSIITLVLGFIVALKLGE